MRIFLVASFALVIIASFLLFYHEQKANAVPVSYNVTSLAPPFTTYTRANLDVLVEAGYNGTVTSTYQGRTSNSTLNYEFGYHPTLPLTLDVTQNITASASVAATQSISISIASGHNNRMLVVGISFFHVGNTDHNSARMSSVAIGANTFNLVQNRTVTCGASACDSEIWYLINPPTGLQTITITPANSTLYDMIAGSYSLYNIRALKPVGVVQSASATSTNPHVTITPTFVGRSFLIDTVLSQQNTSPSSPTDVPAWIGKTALILGMSQYKANPTINAGNNVGWTTTNVLYTDVGVEIIPIQNQLNWGFYLLNKPTTNLQNMLANGSNVYYGGASGTNNIPVNHLNVVTGVETHDFSAGNSVGGTICNDANSATLILFNTVNSIWAYCTTPGGGTPNLTKDNISGNNTIAVASITLTSLSNMKVVFTSNHLDRFSTNGTAMEGTNLSNNQCELTHIPSNTTTPIDDIGCDKIMPNHVKRYWNGMYHSKTGNYYTNSTLNFFTSVDASIYKKQLTIPASIYNIPDPDVKLVGHWNGADYLLSVSSSQINYIPMTYLTTLLGQNRAFQAYELTLVNSDSHFYLSPSSISPIQPIKLYGPSLNTTVSKYGMLTIPSGYIMRTTATSESVIRNVDPRWTNTPQQDYPAITTQSSLFPLVITVSNAPTDSSLWLSNPSQVINNLNSVWCVTQLDSTHTGQCDIPANQCATVYVADISIAPTIFNYEGSVCATGTNQKTIAFTNTLPLTFYTMKFAATHTYTPNNNGLSTTVRSSTAPFTYNVIIKNSTGTITQNFTKTINGTIDTHNFNVTNATKPASLYVTVPGTGQIYSAYMGSALSLASTAAFFHQYLNYQGFDLLAFLPIVFASAFTRNTVGIGTALVVVMIATLSWLSITVVPDIIVYTSIVIAVLSMIGYRGLYG